MIVQPRHIDHDQLSMGSFSIVGEHAELVVAIAPTKTLHVERLVDPIGVYVDVDRYGPRRRTENAHLHVVNHQHWMQRVRANIDANKHNTCALTQGIHHHVVSYACTR